MRGTISGFLSKVSDWPILSRATTDWIAKRRQQDHPGVVAIRAVLGRDGRVWNWRAESGPKLDV